VGRVVRAGQHSGHSVGDRVGFGAHCGSCGICVNCTSEMENYCLNGTVGTYQGKTGDSVQGYTQGGYADYYLASGRFAVPIPPEMGSEEAAPLLCAGVTVYAPLKRYASPGSKVGVIGIGGLGHLGLQFAKALGAEVWAISHSRDKAEDVRALGAVGFSACPLVSSLIDSQFQRRSIPRGPSQHFRPSPMYLVRAPPATLRADSLPPAPPTTHAPRPPRHP
jgi:alcohol dehydrogenase (NADP+)